jgi:hypothetical protein
MSLLLDTSPTSILTFSCISLVSKGAFELLTIFSICLDRSSSFVLIPQKIVGKEAIKIIGEVIGNLIHTVNQDCCQYEHTLKPFWQLIYKGFVNQLRFSPNMAQVRQSFPYFSLLFLSPSTLRLLLSKRSVAV